MTTKTICPTTTTEPSVQSDVISYNRKDSVPTDGQNVTDQPLDNISCELSGLELAKSKEAVDIPAGGSKDKPTEDKAGSSVASSKPIEAENALAKSKEAVDIPAGGSKGKPAEDEAASSLDSNNTFAAEHSVVKFNEEEMCQKLFSPPDAVPNRETLQSVLTENPAVKIPIHQHTFNWLQKHVEEKVLKGIFDIVEEVGNICPKLTPRVEAALHVNVPKNVTGCMYQYVIDAFLMGVIGTAQEYASIPVKLNRNAKDPSMTQGTSRPNFFMMFEDQLVFKGEEKRRGFVEQNAKQLIKTMKPGSVGKDGKLEYMVGYATSGSQILFECIYGDDLMSECSKVLDLKRIADRVTLILVLVNVMRVSRALYNCRPGGSP
ncbi:hypothetical protein EV183_001199 [Coemansia sp. RSA 2336]|nr:hypothetical protein EV183_001199 [Coemansia sp. RSA 2336]